MSREEISNRNTGEAATTSPWAGADAPPHGP
jgi:hypothetical protein